VNCSNIKVYVADNNSDESDTETSEGAVGNTNLDMPDFILDDDLYFEDEEEI